MIRTHGFTLLELLIGLTLLGFILALLFAGFRLAANSWNAFEERAERAADEAAGQVLVRRLVTSAQPIHLRQVGLQPLAFEGRAGTLRLAAPLPQLGLRAIELAIEPAAPAAGEGPGPAMQLVLRQASLRYEAEQFVAGLASQQGRPLVGRLAGAAFSYFGPARRGEPPQWQEEWSSPDQFPSLVRLHLAPRSAAAFDLDMAPMVNGDRTATVRLTVGPQ
jgi:general secretion pathway protein J